MLVVLLAFKEHSLQVKYQTNENRKAQLEEEITYAEAAKGNGFDEEFIFDSETIELHKKYGSLADDLHTDLHECLGHGSGQLVPGVKGDELKNYSSTLEDLHYYRTVRFRDVHAWQRSCGCNAGYCLAALLLGNRNQGQGGSSRIRSHWYLDKRI